MKHRNLKRKGAVHEEDDSEGSWAISYGDMITLLLSFFVIFYNTDFKEEKVQKMNHFLSFEIEGIKSKNVTPGSGNSGSRKKVEVQGLGDFDVKVTEIDNNLVITFGNASFFESGKTEVKKDAAKMLAKFTEKYLPYAGKYLLSIKGFTDKQAVRAIKRSYRDNLELSALRAISAMRHFQKAGIPLNRMEIAGVGELQIIEKNFPSTKNLTKKELDALSRTIVLVIKPEKESLL